MSETVSLVILLLDHTGPAKKSAEGLARNLGLDLLQPVNTGPGAFDLNLLHRQLKLHAKKYDMGLLVTPVGLMLKDLSSPMRPLWIDFCERPDDWGGETFNRKSLLARALGIGQHGALKILDCTAGMARDACLLASLGCHVTMLERSPVLASLIQDALHRLRLSQTTDLARCLHFHQVDANVWLQNKKAEDAVVYIDTMFSDQRSSALPKGNMQFLRKLLPDDDDCENLASLAIGAGYTRVVVKRPLHWQWQSQFMRKQVANHSLRGKSLRYDIFVS
ncbi:MAG: class I SAM-dependent methyltransferase [Gammaproteobacteria bacterium]|nr:class I SAM-dependent methyltransferase [Gammaproteobacteria bacterium]